VVAAYPTAASKLDAQVASLAAQGVVATGLFLSITAWDKTPGRLRLANRDVRLVWFAYEARHTVVVRHGTGGITLLVTPPEAREESASRARPRCLAAPRVRRTC
jgi:hypothetical protein